MIRIESIKKEYEGQVVLDIDHLSFDSGETVGIVGNNGAGKTTLFNIILDLIEPSSGSVFLKDVSNRETENWKQFTSAFIDSSFLINFLTPDEYFKFIGELSEWTDNEIKDLMNTFSDLYNNEILSTTKYIRDLSMGNQKKVGLTGTFIGSPEIIIWDEPFSNLDPTSQSIIKNIIKERQHSHTWLISSHDLQHISDTCDRIIILEKGRIVEDLKNGAGTIDRLNHYFRVSNI